MDTIDLSPRTEVMIMSELRQHEAPAEQIVAVSFRMNASVEEVVTGLLEAVRRTGLSLLRVSGDGRRVYPFAGRNPARTASSWRAELSRNSPTVNLEIFVGRAELFLELPGGVRLEPGAGVPAAD